MEQMGVADQILGRLTDAMRIENGGVLRLGRCIHPRAEPEIAFRIARPLAGRVTRAQALAAVDGVAIALEVIDSRYLDFRFSLTDVVADNTSACNYLTGPWCEPGRLGDAEVVIELAVDGSVVQRGSSAAILGDPWQSLVEAARLAAAEGLELQPGWIVLAGAATAAEALRPGARVSAASAALGRVELRVGGARDEGRGEA